jgi:hypothetical protein
MRSSEATPPIEMFDRYPETREKMLARWRSEFWTPLYQSVCYVSLEQYNQAAQILQVKIQDVISTYGADFAPVWYYSGSGGGRPTAMISEYEYNRRRNELGCPLVSPKPRWGLLALGGAVLVTGTTAVVLLSVRKKKATRGKKKKK